MSSALTTGINVKALIHIALGLMSRMVALQYKVRGNTMLPIWQNYGHKPSPE